MQVIRISPITWVRSTKSAFAEKFYDEVRGCTENPTGTRKLVLGTWDKVAQELSDQNGMAISGTAVWKVAVKDSRSPKVMQALGLGKKRYRRSAEFSDAEQMAVFDRFLSNHDLTLSGLCEGLVNGRFSIISGSAETNDEQQIQQPQDKREDPLGRAERY